MNSLHILVLVGTGTLFLVVLYGLVRVINMTEGLEWSDLISTRAKDGKEYADWNKIGQGLGVVLCVWLPVVYVYSNKMDAGGLAMVMGVALAYLGCVSGYAATLRARQGTVETTRAIGPGGAVENILETPPVAQK